MESPPSLLISDVVMPGLRGPEVAESLRRDFPGLRVLFMSGYADEEFGPDSLDREGTAFLAKPFRTAALLERVASLTGLEESAKRD